MCEAKTLFKQNMLEEKDYKVIFVSWKDWEKCVTITEKKNFIKKHLAKYFKNEEFNENWRGTKN